MYLSKLYLSWLLVCFSPLPIIYFPTIYQSAMAFTFYCAIYTTPTACNKAVSSFNSQFNIHSFEKLSLNLEVVIGVPPMASKGKQLWYCIVTAVICNSHWNLTLNSWCFILLHHLWQGLLFSIPMFFSAPTIKLDCKISPLCTWVWSCDSVLANRMWTEVPYTWSIPTFYAILPFISAFYLTGKGMTPWGI